MFFFFLQDFFHSFDGREVFRARLGTGRDDRPGQANTLIFAIKLSRPVEHWAPRFFWGGDTENVVMSNRCNIFFAS